MIHIGVEDFDWYWFRMLEQQSRKRGNNATKQKYYYRDIITAFDIETTYIKEIDQSVMYIWQWCFGDKCVVTGRTWYELMQFIKKIEEVLEGDRLICFVHNLSFEFQYLSGIYDFNPEDVFAIDHRKVLKALLHNCIEFRCSYLQTNMSLRAFCEKMGVKNYKLKLNYKKRRYWYTDLTSKEMAYCINDVIGLVQAINVEMERDGDNLYTLPLTSTGYVRRECKKVMRTVGKKYIQSMTPSMEIYELLREAFRGGNTHASRYYSNQMITLEHDGYIHSADIASAYPDAIVNDLFPVSKFVIKKNCSKEDLHKLIYERHRACLIRCALENVRLKDDMIPVPYLAKSKCAGIINGVYDNGRILSADFIACTTFTDIDYEIIKKQYDFDMYIITVASARYGKLPQAFRDLVIEYFRKKTQLKNKPGDDEHSADFYELLYNKMKNLLNGLYGLLAQNPVKHTINYVNDPDGIFTEEEADDEELLGEYNKKAFVLYQWGVWVTCHCRAHIQRGIDACGLGFLYCDTDSCKYIGDINWDEVNAPYLKRSKQSGAYASDQNGEVFHMGIFEREKDMIEFKTMGAKKYAYRDLKGSLHITIAGVNKKIGAIELERAGGISAMQEDFQFIYAGGLEARYSDFPEVSEWTTEDGVTIRITRNVSLVDNTKTLGLTAEYRDLLSICSQQSVDL